MRTFLLILGIFFLPACGPKEIGEGTSDIQSPGVSADAAEMMRLPIIGASNTERMLYFYNRGDVVQNLRDWRVSQFKKRAGLKPAPEDPEYRAVPKQRSPFRQ